MVNENQGRTYEPTPIYNRKMIRKMLRLQSIGRDGYHNVSGHVNAYFKRYKDAFKGGE